MNLSECTHPTSRGPTEGMLEDGDFRRVCLTCKRAFDPEPDPEAPDIPFPGSDGTCDCAACVESGLPMLSPGR